MAYLRKEDETVEIDYSLDKVWVAMLKSLDRLEWTVEETDETKHHIRAKTKGGFMSYPSVVTIEAVAMDKKLTRCKIEAETPVTTITALADFGRTRERINLFFEVLAKQLTN